MSGPSFWEFLLLCLIGLIVLGPKRLPQVANQIGTWVGQARRMTRTLKRQLEEELELDKPLNIRPAAHHPPPRDDDMYSPLHEDTAAPPLASAPLTDTNADATPESGEATDADVAGTDTTDDDGERKESA